MTVEDFVNSAWEWIRSPGFAGSAAVVAAVIAFTTARKDRRQKERAERKAQWWSRAEWALNQVTDRDDFTAQIGLNVLDALGNSEWAGEHEGDVIAAATAPFLSENQSVVADNPSQMGDNGVKTRSEAHDDE
ncbi:hypothetical protein B7R22_06410 [Subtercola boreus]|uniref:Uncharacterized protein n=1 Tax=Subtercola boreus TaxID=120213 RepID=A0A3E0W0S0_9MICO|nr:hypothetical protein [Subtercola boreus]RFA15580.1 hypothetical protein B7R22_06410 [Subtercola boreus]